MSDYVIGVDLGTTYSAAAVLRDGRVEVAELGERIASVASVLWFRDDGRVVVGEAAVRRAESEPSRVAREFKRRFGDPVPLIVAGRSMSADALTALLLRWVIDAVIQQEGGEPAAVGVAHPANWGPYKLDLLAQAIRTARVARAVLVSEPHAAAESHATATQVAVGDVVGVYDFGGGTFDAAVLKRGESAFELVGRAEGIERLGGIDFDEAIFDHVRHVLGPGLTDLSHDDPLVAGALLRLREECTRAKELLSLDTEAIIPVTLPDLHTSVRLTRSEFENMIRPSVAATIGTLSRAIDSGGLTPAQLSKVLLVGGSSRIPLVSLMVGAELGRPVALDTHPKHAVAMGSAHLAARSTTAGTPTAGRSAPASSRAGPSTRPLPPPAPVPPTAAAATRPTPAAVTPPAPAPAAAQRSARIAAPALSSRSGGPRRPLTVIGLVLLGVLIVGGAVAAAAVLDLPARLSGQPQAAAAFESDELREFAGNLLTAPGASCAAAPEERRQGQREAVDCQWDNGVQGRFYLAPDRAVLDQVRDRFLDPTETIPDSFFQAPEGWSKSDDPAVKQGEYAQYLLASNGSANIYYDQESTLSWAVLWLPSGNQQELRDFWREWSEVTVL